MKRDKHQTRKRPHRPDQADSTTDPPAKGERSRSGPAALAISAFGPPGRSWGWAEEAGGRCAHVEPGRSYQGTTVQVCGLYPFTAGSGAPPFGVPIGRHLLTREVVCCEPFTWLDRGLVTNTGMFVLGQPGAGKSTIVKRLLTGSVAYGIRGLVLGEPKGEYTDLVGHLGGQVVRIGPGMDRINPLDCGPLAELAARADPDTATAITEEVKARRLTILRSLVLLARTSTGTGITDGEDLALSSSLDVLAAGETTENQPTLRDVLQVVHDGPEQVRTGMYAASPQEYAEETRALTRTLAMLTGGSLAAVLDATTQRIDPDVPVVSLDISRLDGLGEDIVAAAMLATWGYGLAMCSAARWASQLGLRPPTRWLTIMDEMWRALRAASGLVDTADQLTRLGRNWGMASVMVTHTLDDLHALPTEADRAKARGFVERAAITVMAALSERELADVSTVCPMTEAERKMVAGWAAPSAALGSEAASTHPGRGRYMIKMGERTGIPVQLDLVGVETTLYDTDHAVRATRTPGQAGNHPREQGARAPAGKSGGWV